MKSGGNFRVVLVTCASLREGRRIASAVVRKRLAACASVILSPAQSIYRWRNKIQSSREHLLIIKTTQNRLEKLEKEVLRQHSYEVPEFLVLPVTGGSRSYLAWLSESVK
jgi:periplasmic divalent cation tolerance protein